MKTLALILLIPTIGFAQIGPAPVDTNKVIKGDTSIVSLDTAVVLLRKMLIKEETMIVSISSMPECWRLVHDGKWVIDWFYSGGMTHTRNKLFVAKSLSECKEEIKNLRLKISPKSRIDTLSYLYYTKEK